MTAKIITEANFSKDEIEAAEAIVSAMLGDPSHAEELAKKLRQERDEKIEELTRDCYEEAKRQGYTEVLLGAFELTRYDVEYLARGLGEGVDDLDDKDKDAMLRALRKIASE